MKVGGGNSSSDRSRAADMLNYRKQRGRNEKFKGKKVEKQANRETRSNQDHAEVVQNLLIGFVVFVAVCCAFLVLVHGR